MTAAPTFTSFRPRTGLVGLLASLVVTACSGTETGNPFLPPAGTRPALHMWAYHPEAGGEGQLQLRLASAVFISARDGRCDPQSSTSNNALQSALELALKVGDAPAELAVLPEARPCALNLGFEGSANTPAFALEGRLATAPPRELRFEDPLGLSFEGVATRDAEDLVIAVDLAVFLREAVVDDDGIARLPAAKLDQAIRLVSTEDAATLTEVAEAEPAAEETLSAALEVPPELPTLDPGDPVAVSARLLFPPPGSVLREAMLEARGTATAAAPIEALRVNGVAATSNDGFATWQATVELTPGTTNLRIDIDAGAATQNARAATIPANYLGTSWSSETHVARRDASTLFVFERSQGELVEVDLTSGRRVPVDLGLTDGSGGTATGVPLYDAANNRLILVDSTVLYTKDLETGDCLPFLTGLGPLSPPAVDAELDAANNAIFYVTNTAGTIEKIDLLLETQAQHALPPADTNPFELIRIKRRPSDGTLLVLDGGNRQMLGFSPITGDFVPIMTNSVSGALGTVTDFAVKGDGTALMVAGLSNAMARHELQGDNRYAMTNYLSSPVRARWRSLDWFENEEVVVAVDERSGRLLLHNADDEAGTEPGIESGATFADLADIAIDASGETLWLADEISETVWQVDIESGDANPLITEAMRDGATEFFVQDIEYDPGRNQLYISTYRDSVREIYTLNVSTQSFALLYGQATLGAYYIFGRLHYDATSDQLAALTNDFPDPNAVVLDPTGAGIISSTPMLNWDAPSTAVLADIAWDGSAGVFYASDFDALLLGYAPSTDLRTLPLPIGLRVDTGPTWSRALTTLGTMHYVVRGSSLYSYDRESSVFTVISNGDEALESYAISGSAGMAVDPERRVAYVADSSCRCVTSIDLDTGNRTRVIGDTTPETPLVTPVIATPATP